MVDTVRTLPELQDLLPLNQNGQISAQDIRDVLISLWENSDKEWMRTRAYTGGQTVFLNEGGIYRANDDIPANTDFTKGTVGATWRLVADITRLPPPVVSLTDFSIDSPDSVDVGVDLNVARTVRYTVAHADLISSLRLEVTDGTNIVLPNPVGDGVKTADVVLSGIDTQSAGTVTFQIRGVATDNSVIMSNSQTVSIRAPDEYALYGIRPTNDFATTAIGNLNFAHVETPGSSYNMAGTWPAGEFLGILEPADRPVTEIIETVFSEPTLSLWTRADGARTISGQVYNLLTMKNNGRTGTYGFRVEHD